MASTTDLYTYLSKLNNSQLIELADALNSPIYPEGGIVRRVAGEVYGHNDFIIVNALGMACVLSRVLAQRLFALIYPHGY